MITPSNPQTSAEIQYEDKTSSKPKATVLRIAVIFFIPFIIVVNILGFSFLPKIGLGWLEFLIFIASVIIVIKSPPYLLAMWFLSEKPKNVDNKYDNKYEAKHDMTGLEYESHVATKLRNEGYTDVTVTKASGDHGADILAVTPTGITAVIQCKFYKGTVGQEAVQQAVSAREYYHRSQAIVITNSTFTPAAEDFARHTNTILIEKYT